MGSNPMASTHSNPNQWVIDISYTDPGSFSLIYDPDDNSPQMSVSIRFARLVIKQSMASFTYVFTLKDPHSPKKSAECHVSQEFLESYSKSPAEAAALVIERLADDLYYGFYDQELIDLISSKLAYSTAQFIHKPHALALKLDKLATLESMTSFESKVVSTVDSMPGALETVKNPMTGASGMLKNVIMNLNDTHGWTREEIADWLDTLDIDLSFKVPSTEEVEL